jgi:two-component system, NtrC family, sensor kinase
MTARRRKTTKLKRRKDSAAHRRDSSAIDLREQLERRTHELAEAREQQAAASEILWVISSSPTNIQPVFDAIAKVAPRLCGANYCLLYRFDGVLLHLVAHHNVKGELLETLQRAYPMRPSRIHAVGRTIMSAAVVEIADAQNDPEYDRRVAVMGGWRSMVAVPMLRDAVPIGAIVIQRAEAGNFPAGQIALLKTFADQAVIAIENVRLFNEVQARSRELDRSIAELRALSDVSQAVSSTLNLETVLETIVARAVQLSSSDSGIVYEFDEAVQTLSRTGIAPHYAEASGDSAGGTDQAR